MSRCKALSTAMGQCEFFEHHLGSHSHGVHSWDTVTPTPVPTEMTSLVAIKEALKRIEEGQMNLCAAQDKLWQGQAAIERKLESYGEPTAQNPLGLTLADRLGAVEAKLKLVSDQIEYAVVPVLSSLENRMMEAHNLHCSLSTKLEASLQGVTAGTGLAIGELRAQVLGTTSNILTQVEVIKCWVQPKRKPRKALAKRHKNQLGGRTGRVRRTK